MTHSPQLDTQRKKGFSLFEVLIFIVISSFLLVSMVSYRVATIRQSRSGYYKIYATRYAEELTEWIRIQKELNWTDFYTKAANGGTGAKYCVNSVIDLNSTLSTAMTPYLDTTCKLDGIGTSGANRPNIFRRTVTFETSSGSSPVKAAILVEWQEGPNQLFNVPINTTYSN
ncbi:MAG: prepilin-type N-terminal cleavage/methylation domain-containing protein [Candidatus Roizmanbacteria bacterium]